MNDVELVESLVDSLDTGLPDRPDLTPVRSAGARQRRRRRLGWSAGVCAVAGALVVPAVLLAGSGGTAPTVAPDVTTEPGQAVASAPPPPVPAGELAGPEFGVAMRAAVEQALPGVTFHSEALADGWKFSDKYDAYDWTVEDPVRWDTLFSWEQDFRLPEGVHVGVSAWRTSPGAVMGGGGPTQCNQAHYPSRIGCEATEVGDQVVVVNDGIQYEDNGRWYRDVDVSYFDETRGMAAHVSLTTFVDAPTWAQARELLPSGAELTALGLRPELVLPAPATYPTPDDLDVHGSSKP